MMHVRRGSPTEPIQETKVIDHGSGKFRHRLAPGRVVLRCAHIYTVIHSKTSVNTSFDKSLKKVISAWFFMGLS